MFELVPELKSARLQLIVAALDGRATEGELWLYGGAAPSVTGDPTAQALQCVIVLPRPCGVVADGKLTLAADVSGVRLGADVITWGRLVDGAGKVWADFSVSPADGDGALKLDLVSGAPGDAVTLLSGELVE